MDGVGGFWAKLLLILWITRWTRNWNLFRWWKIYMQF